MTDTAKAIGFDYGCEAELFPTRSRKSRNRYVRYRRFANAAEAIRFAIEELPADLLVGAYLQVDEERYHGDGIRRLYESTDYPLARRAPEKPGTSPRAGGSATPGGSAGGGRSDAARGKGRVGGAPARTPGRAR
jgi:hypothetical protein